MPKKICAADADQALLKSLDLKPSGWLTSEASKGRRFNYINVCLAASSGSTRI
jgi:hypothetical protein